MSRSITIVLPLPPTALNPNARVSHWGVRQRATKKYREDCKVLATAAVRKAFKVDPHWGHCTIQPRFFFKRESLVQDDDNAIRSMKAARDALQDAGLVINDKGARTMMPEMGVDAKNPRLELIVTESLTSP